MKQRLRARAPSSSSSTRAGSTWCARRTSRPSTTSRSRPAPTSRSSTRMAHVVVTEGLVDEAFVAERCEGFDEWAEFIAAPGEQPGGRRARSPACRPRSCARRPGSTRPARTRPSTTASASPSTARARRWSWAWPTWRWPPATSAATASASTRCAARTTCRAPATWGRSRTSCRATGTSPTTRSAASTSSCGARRSTPSRGCGSRTCSTPRSTARSGRCSCRARTSPSPTPTPGTSPAALDALELLVVQDLFLNETAKLAHVFLPGTSFLEKDGTFTNAERRINRVRPVMAPQTGKHEWEIVGEIAGAMGSPDALRPARARSWTRSPRPRRPSPGCRSSCSTRSAACSGRATPSIRSARGPCTWASSPAARAVSSQTPYVADRPSGAPGSTR